MNKFKLNDKVIVKVGKDKGKICIIQRVLPKCKSVILDNANFITKHIKPSSQNEGSIKQINKKINWSKIQHFNDGELKVQYSLENNKKVRVLNKKRKNHENK